MARVAKNMPDPLATRETGQVVTVSSTEAQNSLGDLLGRVAKGARVVVTRYGRRQAVILSADEYDALLDEEEVDLTALEREFDEAVARMQEPGHRDAVDALFEMSGEQLGKAALAGSRGDRSTRR